MRRLVLHVHLRVLLDSHHHGWLVVGLIALWREGYRRALRDNLGLLRLDEIDMQCLLLVCGKINVLFMLILFIMRLVESEMELDLDAQKRQQYN